MNTKAVFLAVAAISILTLASGHTTGATSGEAVKKVDTSNTTKETKKSVDATYTIKPGDTLDAIATAHELTYVQLFNANESILNPDVIDVGQEIRIPTKDEQLPQRFAELSQRQTAPLAATSSATPSYRGAAPVVTTHYTPTAGNTYTWGQCTWYVKNKRPDLPNMLGNGGQWSASASARGYATGSTPRVGAVAEQPGHVAYVEAVNGSMVTVSEMNYAGGIGQVHTRTVPASTFYYIY